MGGSRREAIQNPRTGPMKILDCAVSHTPVGSKPMSNPRPTYEVNGEKMLVPIDPGMTTGPGDPADPGGT